MTDAIETFEGRIAKVSGAARTGKTEALVRRVASLLAQEEDPARIMVTTPTAVAAAAFRKQLEALCADESAADAARLSAVRVVPAQEACLAVLDTERARQQTGRVPRVLSSFEYNFFLEDMKTLGVARRRLKAFMRRLQRQWCTLVPESEWLSPGEEQHTLDFAISSLKSLGAMLPDEVAWLCATFLQSEEGRTCAQQFDYVLCDDFQNLSRAQQTSLCLMARKQIIVAGNAAQTTTCATPFPNPQGFARFDELRQGVSVFDLDTAFGNPCVTAFSDAVTAAGAPDAPQARKRVGKSNDVMLIKWNTPDDELSGISKYLRFLVESHEVRHNADIAVVAPAKRWAKMLERSLEAHGIKTTTVGFANFTGDPRDISRAQALVACTKLNLLANPQDAVAWRCWCGYGNYLTNSDAWSELSAFAEARGLALLDALGSVAEEQKPDQAEPFLRANELIRRWKDGQHFIEGNAARRGFALLKAVGADDMREFSDIAAAMTGEESASTLHAMVRQALLKPQRSPDPNAVTITSYEMLAGCTYDYVIACGCVNGLVPTRNAFEVVSTEKERTRLLDEQRRAFSAGVSKACEHLVLSTFSKASLELAETTKMQVARVRFENNERMAVLSPTCFIAEAGQNAPATTSGQALLSSLNLI